MGLGEFNFDTYEQNQSKSFLWIYFLLATFFTQIVFFNMLITVMGTTYETVMANKDRNNLISHTKILSKYVYYCQLDCSRLSKGRYLYIAFRSEPAQNCIFIQRTANLIE